VFNDDERVGPLGSVEKESIETGPDRGDVDLYNCDETFSLWFFSIGTDLFVCLALISSVSWFNFWNANGNANKTKQKK